MPPWFSSRRCHRRPSDLRVMSPIGSVFVTSAHFATYGLSPCHAGPYGDHHADHGDHVAHQICYIFATMFGLTREKLQVILERIRWLRPPEMVPG